MVSTPTDEECKLKINSFNIRVSYMMFYFWTHKGKKISVLTAVEEAILFIYFFKFFVNKKTFFEKTFAKNESWNAYRSERRRNP